MKLGITTPYLRRYGYEKGLERMVKHGYQYLDYQDLVVTETDFFNLPEAAFEAELLRQRAIFESYGISVWQAHGPWRWPLRDLELADRQERFESMSRSIRGTAYLGAKYTVIHPLMPYGIETADNKEETERINIEFFSRLADVGREYGVTVCLENMPFPNFPITTTAQVVDIVRRTGNNNLKVCLDTGHALVCGEPLDTAVYTVGRDLLATMHVHDNDGTADKHLPIGMGTGDFKAYARALREIGFDGVFSLETSGRVNDDSEIQEQNEFALAEAARNLFKIN